MMREIKKLIKTAQTIKLSETKKAFVRSRLEDFIAMHPLRQPVISPLRSPWNPSKFTILHFGKAVSFALIILITGGGTISYASTDSLPGDVLYTVKVNIKEPIEQKLAFSPEAKLQIKTKQIETRLTEAQVLLQKNDMSPEKHKEVEDRVEKKVEEISQTIDELQEKGDVAAILAVTGKLEPVLKAHQEALKEVQNQEISTISETEVDTTLLTDTHSNKETITETVLIPETDLSLTNTEDNSISSETVISNTKSSFADSLLKTVERTLVTVEEKETKALEKAVELEKEELTKNILSDVTDKKVEEAVKEINHIKNTIQTNTDIPSVENSTVEGVIDSNIQTLDNEIKKDTVFITITEAEILLAESKALFEKGLFKESLEKAQEATKLIGIIGASQKIEDAKELEKNNTEQSPVMSEEKILEIKIEDQASQAIKALENTLIQ